MNKPLVSVVVAVYNREDLLGRCVDSLVEQTLEDIEILLVDDQSTDNSWKLMEELREAHPEKIRLFKNEKKGVANAKNTGIINASGKYIAFVDSDDYIDYRMLERLFAETNDGRTEMVVSPLWKVDGTNRSILGTVKTTSVGDKILPYLQSGSFYLHGKLMRRDLFDTYGLLPVLSKGEDLSWLYPTISHLKYIAYSNTPGYYYEYSENSVCKQTGNVTVVKDSLTAGDVILDKVNPMYRRDAVRYVFSRARNIRQQYPIFTYLFDEWVVEHQQILYLLGDGKNLKANKQDQGIISFLNDKIEGVNDQIPATLFVDGVQGTLSDEYIQMCRNAFAANNQDGVSDESVELRSEPVQILEGNLSSFADVPLVVKAYEQKRYDFVAKYLAVKACYEQGGFFIDTSMVIDAQLDAMKYDHNVFSFEGTNTFTEKFFGCSPKSVIFKRILDTYQVSDLYEDEFEPLSSRMKTVLIGLYEIDCVNPHRKKRFRNTVAFYPMNSIICNMEETAEIQFMHCPEIQQQVDDAVAQSAPVIDLLTAKCNNISQNKAVSKPANDSETVRKLKNEIDDIKKSKAWKLVQSYWSFRDRVVRRIKSVGKK